MMKLISNISSSLNAISKEDQAQYFIRNHHYDDFFRFMLNDLEQIYEANKSAVLIIGNCQAYPLAKILNIDQAFSSRYRVINYLPSIHEMSIAFQQRLLEHVHDFDLVLSQRIYNPNWMLRTSEVKKRAKHMLVYPTCFFKGYHPDAIYLKRSGTTVRSSPVIDYHSALVVHSFLHQISISECAKLLATGEWIRGSFSTWIERQFEDLNKRDKEYDIKIVEFLYGNYRKRVLFNTVNHPTSFVLHYIADEVLKNILDDCCLSDKAKKGTNNLLSFTQWLLNERIAEEFDLESNKLLFILKNKPYSVHEYVDLHYRYYESNPDLLMENESNVNRIMEELT